LVNCIYLAGRFPKEASVLLLISNRIGQKPDRCNFSLVYSNGYELNIKHSKDENIGISGFFLIADPLFRSFQPSCGKL
jgi:hypothetical protein